MAAPNIRVVIEALNGAATQIIRALVLDIVANLTRAPSEGGTPVDTGWARANWIPVLGRPSRRAAARPGDDEQTRGAAAALGAQQQSAVAAIATGYRLSQGRITIANNVPYIVPLNEGSSRQAPAGFVQQNIIKAVRTDLPAKFARGF